MSIQPGLKRWISIGAIVLLAVAGTTIAGIQGTGFRALATFGTVETGSGGVKLNGMPYDTSHARVRVDGRPGDIAELRSGHIVAAHGSVTEDGSTAIADEIVLESDVRGMVTAVDEAASTLTVLGQTIRLTAQSVVDPQIQPGSWVKVSAYERSDGSFEATRVDVDLSPGQSQVRGVVQSMNRPAKTLRIGALTVDYSSIQARGPVGEGAVVIARGLQVDAGGTLFASSLEVFDGVGRTGDQGDVQGIVTQYASAQDFEVNGQPVLADDQTVYVLHGQTLGPDLEVRVTGRFSASGVLIARKVQADAPARP